MPAFRAPVYDRIGERYATGRRTDPRIAAQIWAALGGARTVLNVGAGNGAGSDDNAARRPSGGRAAG
jgi:hypothetical protein